MSYSECQTVKKGQVCVHMNKTHGCAATSKGMCFAVCSQCEGCENQTRSNTNLRMYCDVYAKPRAMWNRGDCPMATHLHVEETKKKKINPIKASKRGGW